MDEKPLATQTDVPVEQINHFKSIAEKRGFEFYKRFRNEKRLSFVYKRCEHFSIRFIERFGYFPYKFEQFLDAFFAMLYRERKYFLNNYMDEFKFEYQEKWTIIFMTKPFMDYSGNKIVILKTMYQKN